MPSGTLNRVIWGAMLVLLAVLAFQTRDRFAAYFEGVGKLDVRAAPEEGTVYLRWEGKIDAPMADRVAAAFERYKGEARTFVLSLSSPGGSLDHGAIVIRLLRRIEQAHTLVTSVGAGDECASMCVPVYLQGQRRLAAPSARFMFHEVSFRDFFSEEESNAPQSAKRRETDRLFGRYFDAAGVPTSWVTKMLGEISGGREVWKSGRELVEERSNIVQELE
jgi:ATP-dependent protease ClpP protease subunit